MSPGGEARNMLLARLSIMHVDGPGDDAKQFGAVVDMPFIRLIRPMQADAGPFDLDDDRAPPTRGRPESSAHR
jgi:hypothetical protein